MKSMTGYGRASSRDLKNSPEATSSEPAKTKTGARRSSIRPSSETETPLKSLKATPNQTAASLDVAVRAVNGRFLEVRLHLPREFVGVESDIKALVSRSISRGTVDVYVNRLKQVGASEVSVNHELAKKWYKGYLDLSRALKIKGTPSLELLAKVPDLFKIEENTQSLEPEIELLKSLIVQAAQACDLERQREGHALNAELQKLCQQLEELVESMEQFRAEANADLEKRYRDRLQKLGFGGVVDDQRIAQEIVMQLDRAEISEELTRLREHIKAYRKLLQHDESQGKKLDFYAQELLREVNTIGSKSQVAKLTNLVVDAKTTVEKIREQVQNVE